MWVLKDNQERFPLAILTEFNQANVLQALMDEFGYKRVSVSYPRNFVPPYIDGTHVTLYYDGDDSKNITWSGEVELICIKNY